jgi:dCMP deaminase
MSRISRHQMYMEMAEVVAKRSTCSRLNVGAVLVVNRRVVSIGYNGTEPGAEHCTGNLCPGRKVKCELTIHAEHNAIRYWSPSRDRKNPADMYVTDSPCLDCCQMMNCLSINRVFFRHPYRLTEHLDGSWNFRLFQVLPAGYVMDWQTRELVDVES